MQKNSKRFIFEKGMRILKGKVRKISIFGFDTETANNNKDFVVGSIVGENYKKSFYSREDMIKEIQSNRIFRNSYLYATNLTFDYGALFPNLIEMSKVHDRIDRNSSLIYVRTYCSYNADDFNFYNFKNVRRKRDNFYQITFSDSLNHLRATVEQLGNIIDISKLEQPKAFGRFPENDEEWKEVKEYNLRDSEITFRFMEFVQENYNKLGCKLKVTISSSAMDLFRRKYHAGFWKQEERKKILMQYKAYYGGRTEAFERGMFTEKNYGRIKVYDVVSLYPYCLKNFKYPFPESSYFKNITPQQIESFEGICNITMNAPKHLYIPYLAFKANKLLFPLGKIKGYYDFNSIRNALNLGYEIIRIGEGLVYEHIFKPFRHYIDDLFKLRKKLKLNDDDSQLIPKILMNSFYGKMGFNYSNKEKIVSIEEIEDREDFEELNIAPINQAMTLYRLKTDKNSNIPNYVFPIFPLYVTSYARQVMYNHFKNIGFNRVLYSDTDSIFTTRNICSSNELGELQLEKAFNEVIIVKPKFYIGNKENEEKIIKIKGLHNKIKDYNNAKNMIKHDNFKINAVHFTKFRTALKGLKQINETYMQLKEMDLEDDKRIWEKNKFTLEPQKSLPISI